jgi:hypothetical protein
MPATHHEERRLYTVQIPGSTIFGAIEDQLVTADEPCFDALLGDRLEEAAEDR